MSEKPSKKDQNKMGMSNRWVCDFAYSVTSQHGEDGIIEKILELLGETNKWCVEFGSWDGRRFSNTFNLIMNKGYSAVLIEGDNDRFQDLLNTYKENDKVVAINTLVGFDKGNGLDAILENKNIPVDFDLLSIDIDDNDYHVWEAVRNYKPKIVVIEYNPTIPSAVEFVQAKDMSVNQGSSLLSINKLAKIKGYELVAVTQTNAIFIDAKYFHLFGIEDNTVMGMRPDELLVTYIFNGYDGTVFVRGCGKLGWGNIPYRESRMQLLPKYFRDYPRDYGKLKKVIYKWYLSLYKRNLV